MKMFYFVEAETPPLLCPKVFFDNLVVKRMWSRWYYVTNAYLCM